MSNSVNTHQMRYRLTLLLAVVCAIIRISCNGQESSPPAQTPLSIPEVTAVPEATGQPHPTWFSPDKKWEYKCAEYGLGQCAPEIVKARTGKVVLDLDDEGRVHGPEASQAEVVWSPDSKRFAFNYSPPHAHHTTYKTVAFYQLRGDKWVALRSPADEALERAQLTQLARDHLPKSARERRIWRSSPVNDTLKVRDWTDANTAIVYAYSAWDELTAGFLFTLKFDEAGNWKIVKTRQMSTKELEEEQ
jgi:hypothetical protein